MYFYKMYFYRYNSSIFKKINNKILLLNFKRNRFFPSVLNSNGLSYVTLSLGMFSKFFFKPKPFKKSKQVYLLLTGFLKKIIFYASLKNISLSIKKIPKYLNSIINQLTQPSINFYNHPFSGEFIDEKKRKLHFNWFNIFFVNNRPYGTIKTKKKGRLKRKITKKIILSNYIND